MAKARKVAAAAFKAADFISTARTIESGGGNYIVQAAYDALGED